MSRRTETDALNKARFESSNRLNHVLSVGHQYKASEIDIGGKTSGSEQQEPGFFRRGVNRAFGIKKKSTKEQEKRRAELSKTVATGWLSNATNAIYNGGYFTMKNAQTILARGVQLLGGREAADEFEAMKDSSNRVAKMYLKTAKKFLKDEQTNDSTGNIDLIANFGVANQEEFEQRCVTTEQVMQEVAGIDTLRFYNFSYGSSMRERCILELLGCIQSPLMYIVMLKAGIVADKIDGQTSTANSARDDEYKRLTKNMPNSAIKLIEKNVKIYGGDFLFLKRMAEMFATNIEDVEVSTLDVWCHRIDFLLVSTNFDRLPIHKHISELKKSLALASQIALVEASEEAVIKYKTSDDKRITDIEIGESSTNTGFQIQIVSDGAFTNTSDKNYERINFEDKSWIDDQWRSRTVVMFRLFCAMLRESSKPRDGVLHKILNLRCDNVLYHDENEAFNEQWRKMAFWEYIAYNIMFDETPAQMLARKILERLVKRLETQHQESDQPKREKDARQKVDNFWLGHTEKHSYYEEAQYRTWKTTFNIGKFNTYSKQNQLLFLMKNFIDVVLDATFAASVTTKTEFGWFGESCLFPMVFASYIQSMPWELPPVKIEGEDFVWSTQPKHHQDWRDARVSTFGTGDEMRLTITARWMRNLNRTGADVAKFAGESTAKFMLVAIGGTLASAALVAGTTAAVLNYWGISVGFAVSKGLGWTCGVLFSALIAFAKGLAVKSAYFLATVAHAPAQLLATLPVVGSDIIVNPADKMWLANLLRETVEKIARRVTGSNPQNRYRDTFVLDNLNHMVTFGITYANQLHKHGWKTIRDSTVSGYRGKNREFAFRAIPKLTLFPEIDQPDQSSSDEEVGGVAEGVEGMEMDEAGESSAPDTPTPESPVPEGCDDLRCGEAMDEQSASQ